LRSQATISSRIRQWGDFSHDRDDLNSSKTKLCPDDGMPGFVDTGCVADCRIPHDQWRRGSNEIIRGQRPAGAACSLARILRELRQSGA
jgi:hypothetical protein